jgi:protein-export membrane protein SecD
MLYVAPWKVAVTIAVVVLGFLLCIPNLFAPELRARWPSWVPQRAISLVLDLQGGAHLMFEVDTVAVIKDRQEQILDQVRTTLRNERVQYTNLGTQGGRVEVTIRNPEDFEKAHGKLKAIAQPLGGGLLGGPGGNLDLLIQTVPGGKITFELTEQAIRDRRINAVTQSIEVVRRRIDEYGTREATIQRQGQDRIIVQLPGERTPDRVKEIIGRTAKMTFRLVDPSMTAEEAAQPGRVPPGSDILDGDPKTERDASGRVPKYLVQKRVMVSGDMLTYAQPGPDPRTGQWVVNFKFNAIGAKRFGDVTKENVGRPFAIVLDDKVISAPVIREAILGGSGQISGNFTATSATDLALLLRAGSLPAPLKAIEERSVGPDLGADAIAAGKIAGLIGSLLVVVFMISAYGPYGAVAVVGVTINVVLIFAILSLFQATLTLPGIAAIVLTIGMAVDANVLIYERVREEVRNGRSAFAAMDQGFARASATIIDANVTHILAVGFLFLMGSGPVKGFAIVIGIGILTTLFSAVLLVRVILVTWIRRARPAALYV